MDQPILRSKRSLVGILIVAGVIAAIAVALFASTNDDKRTLARSDATPTATTSADRIAIKALLTQFAQAVNDGDGDALYAIQATSYRQGCTRADFETVVSSVKGQLFTDDTGIQIQGDQALAKITQNLGGGSTVSQSISVQREADGSWKLAAPAAGRCIP